MTKVEKLRLASRVTWLISVALTVNFMGAIARPTGFGWLLLFAACAAVQYAITLAESALFEGTLPPPWRMNWADGGPMPWIWAGAALCLLLDVLLNIGGVAYFMRGIQESATNQVLKESYGADDTFLLVLSQVLVIAFSVLAAIGSELLDAYADLLDGKRATPARSVRELVRHDEEVVEHDQQGLVERIRAMGKDPVKSQRLQQKGKQ